MTHEEATVLKDRLLIGEELSDEDLSSFVDHVAEDPCETCARLRQSLNQKKRWRPRSIREFHALVLADAVLRKR